MKLIRNEQSSPPKQNNGFKPKFLYLALVPLESTAAAAVMVHESDSLLKFDDDGRMGKRGLMRTQGGAQRVRDSNTMTK